MIRNIISRLTMVRTNEEGFYDPLIKKQVYYWQDCYFDCYMATSRFSHRVKINTL